MSVISANRRCILKESTVYGETITTVQIAVWLAIVILVLTAIVESASFSTFWLMLNQLQLTSLIALVGVHIPDEVIERMTGVGLTSFLFEFVPALDVLPDNVLKSWVHYDQPDQRIASIGLESGSTFVNAFSLVVVIVCLVTLNLIYL